MLNRKALKFILHVGLIFGLFLIDYALGNGFMDLFNKLFCKVTCFIKRTIQEEVKQAQIDSFENPISVPVLFMEIFILSLTIAFLKRYTYIRGKDRIDDLLQESKLALQQTNEFLEKWRLRRINWQVPSEYSYLDEEPQEIEPLKLEVPILHMAIVDTIGTARNQLERGDAAEVVSCTDSTLLSFSSLMDDDSETGMDQLNDDKKFPLNDEPKSAEYNNRYLWDVMEEDSSNLSD